MIKFALFSVNMIGFLLMHLFSDSRIMVDNHTPDQLRPGEKKEVRLTINKNEISGFAKLELILPEGLKVSAGETQGASFTFNDRKARFVWITLPHSDTFTVTYFLESAETAQGIYDISGVFAYISDNKRVDYPIPVRKISVQKNVLPTNDTAQAERHESMPIGTPHSEENSTPLSSTLTNDHAMRYPLSEADADTGAIVCTRKITRISDTDFRVDLTIVGQSIKGFVKVIEALPPNCKAEKMEDAGAVVTQEKNSIKFVWFEFPGVSTVVVSYRALCLNPFTSDPQIMGKLSFVENNIPRDIPVVYVAQNNPKTEELSAVIPPSDESTVATDVSKQHETPEQIKVDLAVTTVENKKNENKTQSAPVETNLHQQSKTPVTTVPSAEKGIIYKVQIMAAHRVVDKTYFSQKFTFSEGFNIEHHEGWIKYTTGSFGEYKVARNERQRLKDDYETLPGPFVTAYNDGERITVQEALLISRQKWVQ